ncbi:MAG: START-like domain-containing protein [Dysgonamonadaceae bacterium]
MKKEKYHIEFMMGSASQSSLWTMIYDIEGLSEWFADEVTLYDRIYTFTWNKEQISAEIIDIKPQYKIRLRWFDEEDENIYFEFQLHKLELTGDMTLEITDFAEPDEKSDAITLWESQVDELKRHLGV